MSFNSLFIIYTLTIIATRIFLTFFHIHGRKIGNIQPHHYMHGLVLVGLYFLIYWPVLLAVGVALVVDEIPLFFIFKTWDWPDDHWKQYHSWQSIVGVVAITVIGVLVIGL